MEEQGNCLRETVEQKFSGMPKFLVETKTKQSCDQYSVQLTGGLHVLPSACPSLFNYLASFSGSQSQSHQSYLLVT